MKMFDKIEIGKDGFKGSAMHFLYIIVISGLIYFCYDQHCTIKAKDSELLGRLEELVRCEVYKQMKDREIRLLNTHYHELDSNIEVHLEQIEDSIQILHDEL